MRHTLHIKCKGVVIQLTALLDLGMVDNMEMDSKIATDVGSDGSRKVLVVGVAAGILGMLIGVMIGMQLGKKPVAPLDVNVGGKLNNSLILNQSAAATGKISNVTGKMLTLVDDSGKSQDFQIGEVLTVYKYPVKNAPAQIFSGISAIETGKQVLLNLNVEGSDYVVTTVTYLEPTSSTSSTTATSSGTNR